MKNEHGNRLIMVKDANLYRVVREGLIVGVIFECYLKWYEILLTFVCDYLREKQFRQRETQVQKIL